jgi:hypothetical protein
VDVFYYYYYYSRQRLEFMRGTFQIHFLVDYYIFIQSDPFVKFLRTIIYIHVRITDAYVCIYYTVRKKIV